MVEGVVVAVLVGATVAVLVVIAKVEVQVQEELTQVINKYKSKNGKKSIKIRI